MVHHSESGLIAPIEITREDMVQYRPLEEMAQHLALASYHSWEEVFRASDKELLSKRLIGPKILHLIRDFQHKFEHWEREFAIPERGYAPHLVEVLPEDYRITSRGRRLILVNRLIQIPLLDQDRDVVVNTLLRNGSMSGDEVSQKARGAVSFLDLQIDIAFLNRLHLGLTLGRRESGSEGDLVLLARNSITRVLPQPNGAQLFVVPNG